MLGVKNISLRVTVISLTQLSCYAIRDSFSAQLWHRCCVTGLLLIF